MVFQIVDKRLVIITTTIRFCVSVIEPPPNVVQDPEYNPDGWLGLREGPGKQFKIITTLGGNEYLEADRTEGDWTHISNVTRLSSSGQKNQKIYQGWVLSKYVKKFACEDEREPAVEGKDPGPVDTQPASALPPIKPEDLDPPKSTLTNLPSAMIGGWCFSEGTDVRQVYIRNDGVCVGTQGVLTIWPDSYGGSGGKCTFNKIEKLAMNVYLVKSSCKGLPKSAYDGQTWTENVELQITNGQLKVISVPET
jgi:hypothetical protein